MDNTFEEFKKKESEEAEENQDKTQPPPEGEKEVEDLDRPEKNIDAEISRKQAELEKLNQQLADKKVAPTQQTNPNQWDNWLSAVNNQAETEMAQTGRTVPIQTILQVADNVAKKRFDETLKSRDSAQKAIRRFKRTAQKDPDFKNLEDDFDNLADQLNPGQINDDTLEVLLNSVRGKKMPELLKKARSSGKKQVEEDTKIIGPTTSGSSGTSDREELSDSQLRELENLNSESSIQRTPKEYVQMLKSKKDRFTAAGAKNTPMLLTDVMIK